MDRPDWRKVSYSNGQASCVEVGNAPGHVLIRDTRQACLGSARTVLSIAPAAWKTFTTSME